MIPRCGRDNPIRIGGPCRMNKKRKENESKRGGAGNSAKGNSQLKNCWRGRSKRKPKGETEISERKSSC
ncbi:hypothetical protein EI555_021007 [Monodon monoceros]|uniref:Uncharacterized protein n=1 Tax=Monodon monoceros TaxID=40151 RepID=A0A4U1EQH9_MONMO|nr:hypothetical protein EI555_021007 [Monodon monoceros]